MMNASQRVSLVQTVTDALPLEVAAADCPHCDPGGGCPDPRGCTQAFAETLVHLLERDLERMGVV